MRVDENAFAVGRKHSPTSFILNAKWVRARCEMPIRLDELTQRTFFSSDGWFVRMSLVTCKQKSGA